MPADLKFAFRQLAKSPGFAVVAILSLALGIGANTAVFSLINAVLLRTLPVRNPEQLVIFNWLAEENVGPPASSGSREREPKSNKTTSTSFSIPTFEAFRANAPTLDAVFAFAPMGNLNVLVDGAAEIVAGQVASGDYHRGLGVRAEIGRLFTPDQDNADGQAVAVISYRYWQRRFGGDAAVIGKVITINNTPVTIIGVTSPAFNGALQVGEVVDITLPLALGPRLGRTGYLNDADTWWVRIMGRMKPSATLPQTRASLEALFQATARNHVRFAALPGAPAIDPAKIPLPQLRVLPGGQGLYETRRVYEPSLRLLMGIVALVLLVACANVANLLFARATARRREIAVRLALGATRARVIRQLLGESVLLALLGTVGGLVVASWGAPALLAMRPFGSDALHLDTPLDWRVLGFTSAVALITGIVFGLAPAVRATRLNLTEEFQGGGRTLGGSRSPLAKSLIVVQVALSLLLLIAAGLFVRTLRNLERIDVGFNREGLLLFGIDASAGQRHAPPGAIAALDRIRDHVAALPGVRGATYAVIDPLSGSNWQSTFYVPGYVQTAIDEVVRMNAVDPSFLPTLGIPLLRGRDFDARDNRDGAPKVAIVNEAFAKRCFGTENVIGNRFGLGHPTGGTANIEIIGVMRDAKYAAVKGEVPPVVMVPYLQSGFPGEAQFIIRFNGSEAAVVAAARAAVRDVDARLPMMNVRTQAEQIDRLFSEERLFANLCSFFGLLGLGLAAIGLYGLMSYQVLRRTGEIGVRMALGALPRQVLQLILRESLVLVALGVLLGTGAAIGATRWIANLLFGVTPVDPITYAGVALLLITVAVFASLIPAWRAAKIDPIVALRSE